MVNKTDRSLPPIFIYVLIFGRCAWRAVLISVFDLRWRQVLCYKTVIAYSVFQNGCLAASRQGRLKISAARQQRERRLGGRLEINEQGQGWREAR